MLWTMSMMVFISLPRLGIQARSTWFWNMLIIYMVMVSGKYTFFG
jgi:hypothetical protein